MHVAIVDGKNYECLKQLAKQDDTMTPLVLVMEIEYSFYSILGRLTFSRKCYHYTRILGQVWCIWCT